MFNSEEKQNILIRVVRKKFSTEKNIALSPLLKLNGWSLKWCIKSESKMIYATDMGSLLNHVQVLI